MPKVMKKANRARVARATPLATTTKKVQSLTDKMDNLMKRIPKGTFATGGGLIGGALGGPAGRALGTVLGSGISAITGYGDYEVRSNSLLKRAGAYDMERSPVDDLPQFVRRDHAVNVIHREYFGDLVVPAVPTAYNNTGYVIQPSNPLLFPWLSRIAKQYQQYRIRGMVVEFKSNTTDYAAAGPLGNVGITTNYNLADLKFDTLVKFQNCEFAVVTKPSRNIMHAIECSPQAGRDEWLFVRDVDGENPAIFQDPRFNDFGLLQVCTAGLPGTAGSTLGQLWVSYDIEFAKPVLGTPDNATTAGVLCVSTPDTGVLASVPSSGVMYRTWDCTSFAPAASTYYAVFLPSAVISSSGNISSTVVSMGAAGNFSLRRPGMYFLAFRMFCTNGVASTLITDGTTAMVALSASVVGSATVSVNALDVQVPQTLGGVNAAVYTTSLLYVMTVTGANDTNYVDVTPPQFKSAAGSLVSSIVRQLALYWVSLTPGNYVP